MLPIFFRRLRIVRATGSALGKSEIRHISAFWRRPDLIRSAIDTSPPHSIHIRATSPQDVRVEACMLNRRTLIVAAILAAAVIKPVHAEDKAIVVASTTSTQDSGLFDHILPLFKQKTGTG